MRPLVSLLALVLGVGCAGDVERAAPWREPGLWRDKPSWLKSEAKDPLSDSRPLTAADTGTAPANNSPATGAATGQPLPSSGYW